MAWPDIFFKAKKRPPEAPTPPTIKLTAESPKPDANGPQPPSIKPLPAGLAPQPAIAAQQPQPASGAASAPASGTTGPMQVSTRTLPAMHGVVLRPPQRLTSTTMPLPSPTAKPSTRNTAPLKNIQQLMEEADPLSTLNQTANLAALQRKLAEAAASASGVQSASGAPVAPTNPAKSTTPIKPPLPAPTTSPASAWTPPPFPAFQPAAPPVTREVKRPDPVPAITPSLSTVTIIPSSLATQPPAVAKPPTIPPPAPSDHPFILKPAAAPEAITPAVGAPPVPAAASTKAIIPPAPSLEPVALPMGSVIRRKARLTDLAKIVLPPKREDTQVLHPPMPPNSSGTVVPPAFPVAAMTARATQPLPKPPTMPLPSTTVDIAPTEKTVLDAKPAEPVSSTIAESKAEVSQPEKTQEIAPEPEKPAPFANAPVDAVVTPPPFVESKPVTTTVDLGIEPKVDAEAHKPEPIPASVSEPKVDPEAHRPEVPKHKPSASEPVQAEAPKQESIASAPAPSSEVAAPAPQRERKEFHLANGERVAGFVLSETPEAVYVEHSTLGVLTIPRAQIAKRLVEIILINGDRIVGDIMAETVDTLYVRHASLGMLTVPRAQRSTRVVEAILNDGDRILGEVLSETDTYTVIKSATMGTITVPHNKVTMLNRKIEQVELKALPPSSPELKNKTSE